MNYLKKGENCIHEQTTLGSTIHKNLLKINNHYTRFEFQNKTFTIASHKFTNCYFQRFISSEFILLIQRSRFNESNVQKIVYDALFNSSDASSGFLMLQVM